MRVSNRRLKTALKTTPFPVNAKLEILSCGMGCHLR